MDKMPANEELGFLYKKCKLIRPWVISALVFVPEYMDALKSYPGSLNDETVFEVIKNTYVGMLERGEGYRTARAIAKRVSQDVRGDPQAWQEK